MLFSLLLPFFSVGVVIFAAAIVMPNYTVAVAPMVAEHKERAAGESLISENP